jgi:dipeptidyl aminopeptidase/acylaminoacyl peptidase
VPRPPRPEDLYRLRIATDPRLSPDGRWAVVTVQTVAPSHDAYRHALWLVSTDDGSDAPAPRRLTLGLRHDTHARFSPDGRTLAFLSDRRPVVEEEPSRPKDGREDGSQIHLLPLDGPGEARRLTDLPRGVQDFAWSPDGSRLVLTTASLGATVDEDARRRGTSVRPGPGDPPDSDARFIDRLGYMVNGAGFRYDRVEHLWLVDVGTAAATRLTDGPVDDTEPT